MSALVDIDGRMAVAKWGLMDAVERSERVPKGVSYHEMHLECRIGLRVGVEFGMRGRR